MKVKPIGSRVYLKVSEPKAGMLNLESKPSAVEFAEVLEVGPDCKLGLKKGDKVLFKSWAVDICTHGEERYHFIDESTAGICAIIK